MLIQSDDTGLGGLEAHGNVLNFGFLKQHALNSEIKWQDWRLIPPLFLAVKINKYEIVNGRVNEHKCEIINGIYILHYDTLVMLPLCCHPVSTRQQSVHTSIEMGTCQFWAECQKTCREGFIFTVKKCYFIRTSVIFKFYIILILCRHSPRSAEL